tara:strand:- start:5311 stop:5769 length:459 start_codon:yes stop_codon:yes gene_type:complete
MSSKKQWGNACWYLFHTLAYKLKEEHAKEVHNILNHIIAICSNLPCPDCSTHAIQTLNRLNKKAINSKESLINAIFQFHNIVNKRTGKSQFSRKEHDELYARASFYPIYNNFWNVMLINAKGERAMIYNLARKNALLNFDKYIKQNVHIFNI